MCASCGCGMLNEDHGDQRMITMNDLEQAAEASEISVSQVVQNLQEAAGQAETEEAAVSPE